MQLVLDVIVLHHSPAYYHPSGTFARDFPTVLDTGYEDWEVSLDPISFPMWPAIYSSGCVTDTCWRLSQFCLNRRWLVVVWKECKAGFVSRYGGFTWSSWYVGVTPTEATLEHALFRERFRYKTLFNRIYQRSVQIAIVVRKCLCTRGISKIKHWQR